MNLANEADLQDPNPWTIERVARDATTYLGEESKNIITRTTQGTSIPHSHTTGDHCVKKANVTSIW